MRPRYVEMAGAPVNGVNEAQTHVFDVNPPTGGTFTISFDGQTTAAIAWNATAAAIQSALVALSNIGTGNVVVTGGPMPGTLATITFGGHLGGLNLAEITTTLTNLTGGTPVSVIATTVAGVQGSYRGCDQGTYFMDTTNGAVYANSGTRGVPVWSILSVT